MIRYPYRIAFKSFIDAFLVLLNSKTVIYEYGAVRFTDILDLASCSSPNWLDTMIEWDDLSNALIINENDEWILMLPETEIRA